MNKEKLDQIQNRCEATFMTLAESTESQEKDTASFIFDAENPEDAYLVGLSPPQANALERILSDREELLGEVRRLKSNYKIALDVLEDLMRQHGRTMPGHAQGAINEAKTKIAGLT